MLELQAEFDLGSYPLPAQDCLIGDVGVFPVPSPADVRMSHVPLFIMMIDRRIQTLSTQPYNSKFPTDLSHKAAPTLMTVMTVASVHISFKMKKKKQ